MVDTHTPCTFADGKVLLFHKSLVKFDPDERWRAKEFLEGLELYERIGELAGEGCRGLVLIQKTCRHVLHQAEAMVAIRAATREGHVRFDMSKKDVTLHKMKGYWYVKS